MTMIYKHESIAAAMQNSYDIATMDRPGLKPVMRSSTVGRHAGALQDTWHQVRALSWQVLDELPTPLPGLARPQDLEPLLAQARQLLSSPRMPECDAGLPLSP